jgi:hypothetical protein
MTERATHLRPGIAGNALSRNQELLKIVPAEQSGAMIGKGANPVKRYGNANLQLIRWARTDYQDTAMCLPRLLIASMQCLKVSAVVSQEQEIIACGVCEMYGIIGTQQPDI